MISDIGIILWLFVPAMVANATAMLSRFIPKNKYLDMPVDLGKSWRGKRILGDGKTVKGFLVGTSMAIFVCTLQIHVQPFQSFTANLYAPYLEFSALLWGFLAGFGALFGDSVESFFKRRLGIDRGKPWFPFDQIDYAIGAILLTLLYKQFPIIFYIELIAAFLIVHVTSRIFWEVTGFNAKSEEHLRK